MAWFLGLGAMTAFEVIEWPVALIVGAAHAIQLRAHNQVVKQLAGGAESGA
jgi:Na+-transporting methylmalonyl-CoA/oxaloacetate decarboxylase beta subunit